MPESYKGQFENFKKTSEAILNDPLMGIKHSLENEEEKFNAMDEEHSPLLFFSMEANPDKMNFCNLYGGMTLRKTDGKIAMFFRYMYPDGSKKWTVLKGQDGSVWQPPHEPLSVRKMMLLAPFQLAARKFEGVGRLNVIDLEGNEPMDEVVKKLQESDLVYMAKIDKKSKKIKYINGEKE